MPDTVHIGCGAGFMGDRIDASLAILDSMERREGPRYLMFEVLAERIELLRHPLVADDFILRTDHGKTGLQKEFGILAHHLRLFLAVIPVIFSAAEDERRIERRLELRAGERGSTRAALAGAGERRRRGPQAGLA